MCLTDKETPLIALFLSDINIVIYIHLEGIK